MSKIDDLQNLLKRLPGIGPRQSRRFVYFLLAADSGYVSKLISLLEELRTDKSVCSFCNRLHFDSTKGKENLCPTCTDTTRDLDKVLVIEKNSDYENFERSGVWKGRYFLVRHNIKLTEKDPEQRLPLQALLDGIIDTSITEIVTALSVNPDGEYTTEYIHKTLSPACKEHKATLSTLARGLSTGSEIEYADTETLRNALENRK